ncbi:MAG TPA: GIY-YIG nuclease family protein [bacterium]|nr:GIY-YIG nuclease family protein [bacterium]
MKSYYIYILHCADGSYYIGVTNNVDRRLYEHQNGLVANCYTYYRRPVLLRYVEEYSDINEAIAREKQLKRWTLRKKEVLIAGDGDRLCQYAKPAK